MKKAKINQANIEKLSIADLLALSMSIGGEIEAEKRITQEQIEIGDAIQQDLERRKALLFCESKPFDFCEWLREKGWELLRTTYKKEFDGYVVRIFCVQRCFNGILKECFDTSCIIDSVEKLIFNDCLIPNTIEEAETLFKLFRL